MEDGTKELIAMVDGQRESEQSWLELLVDAKSRGLEKAPKLATGDIEVVASDGSFHSRALDTDEEFSFKFATPGEYGYFCGLHPHMQGKIVVTR